MAERILLDRLEFYITNVCNLTCNGCNRYNNYHFKGWTSWDEWAEDLERWSKYIDVRHPVILGGEPLMNRDIVKWVNGLRKLWPDHSGVQIQSNGTRIDRVRGLYDVLDPKEGNWIGISIHNPDDKEEIFSRIRNFLTHPIRETADKNHPIGSDFQFYDANNTYVHAWMSNKFVQSNIIELDDGTFTVYNHDNPERAHEICTFRRFKNYHWINGRIYKCGPAALMPEFDRQHHFDISEEDRAIMHGYRGLSVDEFDERGHDFLAHIDDMIPQCKFCPQDYDYKPITFSDRKKNWRISTEIL
jgi:organic radical activating enzyme